MKRFKAHSVSTISMAALASAMGCGSAMAQDAAPAASEQPAVTSGQLEEIVVSARRRSEDVQHTPVAITAISPAQLESTGAIKLSELQGAAPNVLITQQASGGAAANISIRGLAFADVDKSLEPSVAVMIDDVFIGTNTGQLLDLFDIESLEVMRGPQGTLFGRNTIGGVISLRRSRPTGVLGGKLGVEYGSYNTFTARSVLNLPTVGDILSTKLWYFHTQSDGWYKQFGTGKSLGGNNNENFGAAFLLKPSSSFDALLTIEKQVQDAEPANSSITASGEIFCSAFPAGACDRNTKGDAYTAFTSPASAADGKQHYSKYSAPALTLQVNWDLDAIKITSVTSYRKSKEDMTIDYGTYGVYDVRRRQNFHQFSQELRGSGKITSSLDYVAGVYYFGSRYHVLQDTWIFGTNTGAPQNTTGWSKSYAAFADLNWSFASEWRLSVGGRYTHDQKQQDTALGVTDFGKVAASWNKFTPKVSIDYRPSNDVMAYASWSRGYRAGGFSGRGLTALTATTPFDPETVDSFEVGLKTAWFDRHLFFNTTGFYTKYKNLQQNTTVPGGPTGNQTLVTNVGAANIWGLEVDLTAKPVDRLTIRGSVGYLHSKFRGFLSDEAVGSSIRTFDYSGVDLIYAPKFTASVSADYVIPSSAGDFTFNSTFRYITRYDQQVAREFDLPIPVSGIIIVPNNDLRVRTDTLTLLDASISFKPAMFNDKVKLGVFARNLLDDRGTDTAFTVSGLWSFATAREPRVFGGQIGFEF